MRALLFIALGLCAAPLAAAQACDDDCLDGHFAFLNDHLAEAGADLLYDGEMDELVLAEPSGTQHAPVTGVEVTTRDDGAVGLRCTDGGDCMSAYRDGGGTYGPELWVYLPFSDEGRAAAPAVAARLAALLAALHTE